MEPVTISAIKTIHDLVIGLLAKIKDRQMAAELAKIQTLISAVQSDQSALRDRNFELLTQNGNLQFRLQESDSKHAAEMAKMAELHAAEIARLKKPPYKGPFIVDLDESDEPQNPY